MNEYEPKTAVDSPNIPEFYYPTPVDYHGIASMLISLNEIIKAKPDRGGNFYTPKTLQLAEEKVCKLLELL